MPAAGRPGHRRSDGLHILVNNAGATWGEPLETFPDSAWDKVLDLNVKSPFWMVQALLPALREAGTADDPRGSSTSAASTAYASARLPTYSYASSKAALHQLTRVLARELGPQHITVNAVAPGPFPSKMMAATLEAFGDAIADVGAAAPDRARRRHGRHRRVPGQQGGLLPHRGDHPGRRRHRHDRERMTVAVSEQRAGVDLTNLDEPLSPEAGATKRDLVDYLDAVADRILPGLAGRPLTVLRVLRGQKPFMQKNVPEVHPGLGAHRADVGGGLATARCTTRCATTGARCCGWPTNVPSSTTRRWGWPATSTGPRTWCSTWTRPTTTSRRWWPSPTWCGRRWPTAGWRGAVKTSGAKGIHVFVPIDDSAPVDDVAAATRALAARAEALDPSIATTAFIVEDRGGKVFVDSTRAGGATVAAAYSPRLRPGTPVSFPLDWDELERRHTGRLHRPHGAGCSRRADRRGRSRCREPQRLPTDLIEFGRTIPVARVAAMHEGKRRARARRQSSLPLPAGIAFQQGFSRGILPERNFGAGGRDSWRAASHLRVLLATDCRLSSRCTIHCGVP